MGKKGLRVKIASFFMAVALIISQMPGKAWAADWWIPDANNLVGYAQDNITLQINQDGGAAGEFTLERSDGSQWQTLIHADANDITVQNVDDVFINADSNAGGAGNLYLQKGGTTLMMLDSNEIDMYQNLDMNNRSISNASSLGVNGAATVGSTLGVGGATTLGSTLNVTGNTTLSGATQINNTLGVTGPITNLADVVIAADNDNDGHVSEGVILRASGVDGMKVTSTTTTIYGNLNMDNGAISNATTINASGTITGGNLATGGTLNVNGNSTLSGTLAVTGNTTLSGSVSSVGSATLGTNAATVNTFGSGASSVNTIGSAGSSANLMTGATNTLTGTTSNTITGPSNVIQSAASGSSRSIITADTTQASVQYVDATGDSHGLTVDATHTTLSGGTNSSSLTLSDAGANLAVGNAVDPEETVLTATNTAGVTDVTISSDTFTVTGETSLNDRLLMNGNNINMGGGNINAFGGNVNLGGGNLNTGGGNVNMGGGNINNVNNLTVNGTTTLNGGTSIRSTSGLFGMDVNDSVSQLGYQSGTLINGVAATAGGVVLSSTDTATPYSSTVILDNSQAYISYNDGMFESGLEAGPAGLIVGSNSGAISLGMSTDTTTNEVIVGYIDASTGEAYGLHADNDEVNVGYNTLAGFHGLTVDAGSTTLTGGTNSSSLTLSDAGANLAVGNAVDPEETVLTATNTAGVTDVTISSDTFNVTGDSTLNGTLDVDGATTLNDTLTVVGATELQDTLTVAGATELQDTLDVTGATTLNDTLHVVGAATLDSTLNVAGNLTATGAINMIGTAGSTNTITGVDNFITATNSNTMGVTGGSAVTTTATQVSALTADGSGLIVNNGGVVALKNSVGDDGYGTGHGLTINPDSTVLSGGTTSTTLTLNDDGATFANTTTGGPARVTGVADGVNPYDAVNVSQIRGLERDIKRAHLGIASVSALSAIPGVAPCKRFAIGAGYGYFEGENAVAVGLKARLWDNVNVQAGLGFGVGYKSDSTYSANAGFSYSF